MIDSKDGAIMLMIVDIKLNKMKKRITKAIVDHAREILRLYAEQNPNQRITITEAKKGVMNYKTNDMKTYEVLCKTCGGTGYIMPANFTGETTSTPSTEICPVCKGNKTQTVHETD